MPRNPKILLLVGFAAGYWVGLHYHFEIDIKREKS